jgi:DNA invertase Pin-like site-specific DNA recombinase
MNTNATTRKLVASLSTSLQSAAASLSALNQQMMVGQERRPSTAPVRRGRRGRRQGATKLGTEHEAQIVELLTRPGIPIPIAAIAKAFGVSRPTVYNIRDRNKLRVHKRDRHSTNRLAAALREQIQQPGTPQIAEPMPAQAVG